MKQRKLGKNGPLVSQLGLGCMGMSEFYPPFPDEDESISVIKRAYELGITFFDTSDMYGRGHNEQLLGKAVKGFRNKVIIASKFGVMRGPNGEFLGTNGKPEYVQQACDASLKRFGMDVIDLYQQHRVDRNVPIEETVGAMSRLVEQGKVRWLGLSEASAQTLRRAVAVHPVTSLQSEYSLWERGLEKENIPVCRELGIGLIAYSPLGRGFLSGKYDENATFAPEDTRSRMPRFQGENLEHNRAWLKEIERIATDRDCTPAQLALAWALAQGDDVVPIPGTKHIKYLEENVSASAIGLSNEELASLNDLTREGVSGDRYPTSAMVTVNA